MLQPQSLDQDFSNWTYRGPTELTREVVIFDVDGVLSDASARQHFIRRPQPDWEAFFSACDQDPLIVDAAALLSVIEPSCSVVFLTGRPLSAREKTLNWIGRHELRWDLLVMRHWGDYSAARTFKRYEIAKLRAKGLEPKVAFEDDPRNVEMLKAQGVPCVYLYSGYY